MIGIDHQAASIDIRQIFAMTSKEKEAFLGLLKENPLFSGCILLSTCNRTELWFTAKSGNQDTALSLLCDFVSADFETYCPLFTKREGAAAVTYLFSLSSGLNSQIFGEDQILTQVKDSLDFARKCDVTDTVLEVLFRRAITGAKEAKTKMQQSTANVGAAEYCIKQLLDEGYDFHGKTCMVIGNGKMGQRTALALVALGATVTVTVRQYRSGVVEIPKGCERIDYGCRLELLPLCDIVVSATASPNTTLKLEHFYETPHKDGLILLDLAVPRDVDPAIGNLEGITLYDIDSFQAPPSEELESLKKEVEVLLDTHIADFHTWHLCRNAMPMVGMVTNKFAKDTMWRLQPALGHDDYLEQVEKVAQKQLQRALFAIRDEAGADTFHKALSALEKLYG